ncbi:MAG: ABC transporter permease [Spirochaetia bacterium]
MSFTILASTAWKALHRKPSRSLLTMLGVIIGVFAVISSMAIGAGARAAVLRQIESLGSNRVTITPGSVTSGGVRHGAGSRITLRVDDAAAIATDVPEIAAVAPYSEMPFQVVAGVANWYTMIGGTRPAWLLVGNWSMAEGTFITDEDVTGVAKAAVLGIRRGHRRRLWILSGSARFSPRSDRRAPLRIEGKR